MSIRGQSSVRRAPSGLGLNSEPWTQGSAAGPTGVGPLAAGQPALAQNEVREALRLRPDWEQAALLMGGLLQQRNANGEAAAYFQDFLKRYPRAMDVRLNYARALVGEKKYPEARAEFQNLLKEFPDNPDVSLAVGLLSLPVFGADGPAEHEFAVLLGRALQLTNILRDIKDDLEKGRVYIPQEDLRATGCRIEDLAAGKVTEPVRRLMELECGRAHDFYERARRARPDSPCRSRLPARGLFGRAQQPLCRRPQHGAVWPGRLGLARPANRNQPGALSR